MLGKHRAALYGKQLMAQRITAAFCEPLDGEVGSIVFLPEGKHRITATVNGKAKQIDVEVDRRVLASFSEDLEKRKESNVRPFAGFDHRPGPASFLPLEFRYEDGIGLVLDIEWTQAGRSAIDGRDYSYFSPSFLLRDGVPFGLPSRGEVGSLVNDPAFESIPRIAAGNATEEQSKMDILNDLGLIPEDTTPEAAVEAAKATVATLRESASKVEAMQGELDTAKAEYGSMEEELEALKKERDELLAKLAEMEASASAAAASRADAAVDEAVKAGRIAPKDEDTKAFWREQITANADAVKALNAISPNPALSGESVLAGRADAREIEKELPRSEFDAKTPQERMAFVKAGGRIVEG